MPVLHSQADMGSVSESLGSLYSRRLGEKEWERHVRMVDDMWKAIRGKIDRMDLDYPRLLLYQDGLPTCGREEQIVRDLAGKGSQNHQLLVDLIERGAQLVGTESLELLMEEYELMQQTLKSLESGDLDNLGEPHRKRKEALLKERDRFIAIRIHETLHQGETGIIFLGLLHSLREYLPHGVQLVTLDEAVRPRSQ